MMSRRFSGFVLLAALGAGTVLGAIALTAVRDALEPVREAADAPSPAWAAIGTSTTEKRVLVTLVESWAPAPKVSMGPIEGRVTALAPEERLVSGSEVVSVDGAVRPAMASEQPLWRELAPGAAGADVADVAELLADLGLGDELAGRETVDEMFARAVRRFEIRHGWEPSGVFKPEYVVWLPSSPFEVGDVVPDAGDYVESGDQLLEGKPRLLAASVAAIARGESLDLPDGSIVFEIPDVLTVPLSSDGRVESPEALAALADHILKVQALSEAAPSDQPTPPGVPAARFGVVRLAEPRRLQTVPTAAILISAEGAACVVSESGGVTPVTVTGGFGGVTEIDPSLAPDERVLVNPPESEYSC